MNLFDKLRKWASKRCHC